MGRTNTAPWDYNPNPKRIIKIETNERSVTLPAALIQDIRLFADILGKARANCHPEAEEQLDILAAIRDGYITPL